MKKLNRLTLNKIDKSNLLKKNELKKIVGGYINCLITDHGSIVMSGPCADPSYYVCQKSCMDFYRIFEMGCDCH